MVPIQIKTCLENNIVLNWTMLKEIVCYRDGFGKFGEKKDKV